jgi:hypothetical protein
MQVQAAAARVRPARRPVLPAADAAPALRAWWQPPASQRCAASALRGDAMRHAPRRRAMPCTSATPGRSLAALAPRPRAHAVGAGLPVLPELSRVPSLLGISACPGNKRDPHICLAPHPPDRPAPIPHLSRGSRAPSRCPRPRPCPPLSRPRLAPLSRAAPPPARCLTTLHPAIPASHARSPAAPSPRLAALPTCRAAAPPRRSAMATSRAPPRRSHGAAVSAWPACTAAPGSCCLPAAATRRR